MEGYIKSNFLENYNENSKKAILVVNFGTTHFDTREETIEVLIKEVKEKFTDFEIRECYTSRIILKKLREKNIFIDNPVEAMERLKNEGYTHVIIISSNVIDGIEYKALVKNIEHFNGDFQELRIAPPLLNTNTSFLKVAKVLNEYFGNPSEKEGFEVNLNLTSLGAIKEIRDIFVENGELLLNYKKEDILEKKLFYSR